MDLTSRRRFFLGVLLAWAPLLFFVWIAFRDVSSQKTSGLGAIVGGISYALSAFGLLAGLAVQIVAIYLLVRSCREDLRPVRIVAAAISVCWAVVIVLGYGLLLSRFFGFSTNLN